MRKLFIFLSALLLSANCYAGTISIDSLVTADDLTITWINSAKNTIVNALNSIDGSLIRANTISSDSLTNNANVVPRWDDSFNDYVITGLLPATSASLVGTTTAGRAIIYGYYVEKDATSHTYTASKDTYVDLSKTGVYTYTAVANGAAAPSTASNSIRLAKVVTDATTVSSVTDLRITSIDVGNKEDKYIEGLELIVVSPDSYVSGLVTVDAGICYVGSTRIAKTTPTTLKLSEAASWYDASTHGVAGKWCKIGVDDSGNIKLLGAVTPDYSASSVKQGIKKYWYDTANTEYWRIIGTVFMKDATTVSWDYYQVGNTCYYRDPKAFACGNSSSWSEVPLVSIVDPNIVEEAYFYVASGAGGNSRAGLRNVKCQDDGYKHYVEGNVGTWGRQPFGWIYITNDSYSPGIDYMEDTGAQMKGFVSSYKLNTR